MKRDINHHRKRDKRDDARANESEIDELITQAATATFVIPCVVQVENGKRKRMRRERKKKWQREEKRKRKKSLVTLVMC